MMRPPPPNSQRVLAIGEETGQKERLVPYSNPDVTSPSPLLHNQSDESERDDSGLSKQIVFLTTKNQQLQRQLEERELERDRLREQLEMQRADKGHRSIYSPPGLPSRVLDGRKVLRDSVPVVTSPGIPQMSSSCGGSPIPPSLTSPRRVLSPLPLLPHASSPSPHLPPLSLSQPATPNSPRPRPPKDHTHQQHHAHHHRHEAPPPLLPPGREEFVLPRPDSANSDRYHLQQQQLNGLKRSNFELECRLRELAEEKRRLESELKMQKENFLKMQAREQDLLKDIEVLRDENSHHTGAIKRLQGEREGLKTENEGLQDELSVLNDKLNKTEKYYKEVEHENLSLEADIKQLLKDKRQLSEERQKLQIAVESALKTKENYRSTIKQLREQNQSLEGLSRPDSSQPRPEKKKVVVPATKEQKALSEVMNLREEKLHLQDRLLVAQQEIDSLEAHLKVSDRKDASPPPPPPPAPPGTNDGLEGFQPQESIRAHISLFQSQVDAVRADLDAVHSTVSLLGGQQQQLVRESFLALASNCRSRLSAAGEDKAKLSGALRQTEHSLGKMEEDFQALKGENAKLRSQREAVSMEVEALKEQVAQLHDQKRLQAVKLTQSETLAQEREERLRELERAEREARESHATSEKNWKRERARSELEWQGKVAEALQSSELLAEERDQLVAEKERLESELSRVTQDNERLAEAKMEKECQVSELEEKMVDAVLKSDRNERSICKAQEEMASLLSQRAVLSARLTVEHEIFEAELQDSRDESSNRLAEVRHERDTLRGSVGSLQDERVGLFRRLGEVAEKERHIDALESEILTLTQNQSQLQSEMESMTSRHAKVVQEFRMLEDSEHARRLDNEMVKMTLSTEIELLKSKLSSVTKEKGRLERRMGELASEKATSSSSSPSLLSQQPQAQGSAFHTVSSSSGKQMVAGGGGQLKKQMANTLPADSSLKPQLQQQRKAGTLDSRGDFQTTHLSLLEAKKEFAAHHSHLEASSSSSGKGQHLKEPSSSSSAAKGPAAASSSTSPPSSHAITALDEETVAVLRRKVTDMSRKTFFLESDKRSLGDKVRSLSASLKSAREARDHVTADQVRKLREENTGLRDRVQKLEGSLTKQLMAADSKIVETVRENDKLRQRLVTVQAALGGGGEGGDHTQSGSGLETGLLALLKSESEVLKELRASVVSSCEEIEKLEVGQQRIEALQREIQLGLSSADETPPPSPREGGGGASIASSSSQGSVGGGRGVPAVFKSLPEGYISNLQGQRGKEQASKFASSSKANLSSSVKASSSSPSPKPFSTSSRATNSTKLPPSSSPSPSPSVALRSAEFRHKVSEMGSLAAGFSEALQAQRGTLKQREADLTSLQERLAETEARLRPSLEVCGAESGGRKEAGSGIRVSQLQAVMQKQIEQLQDQVIDRDSALSDIETQMKADFELHHKKFAQMKSQVLELREQLSTSSEQIRSKDQYIQKIEERCLSLEGDLFKSQKELERVGLEQKEVMRAGLPENLQLQGVGSVSEVIRLQSKCICLAMEGFLAVF